MPLYDYRCAACGREVEVMHGIHGSGPEACEACGGAMNKLLSPPAIHFKGSGWAKKDAAASTATKAKPKAASSTTPPEAGDGGSSAKSDAKESASTGAEPEAKASTSGSGSD